MPIATSSSHSITQPDHIPQMSNISSKPADPSPQYVVQPSLQWRDESPRTDRIAALIKHVIDEFSLQTFENFQTYHNRLHAYPADHSRSAKGKDGTWIGYKKYTLDTYGQEPKSMRVRLARGRIWVKRSKYWIALEAYLSGLSPPANIWEEPKEFLSTEDKNKLWVDQWTWWRKTAKKFRLLELPTEVREIILWYSVVRVVHPYPKADCRRLFPRHAAAIVARGPNMALLRANKQVYTEGEHLLFRDSVFLVEHATVLNKIMADEPCRNRITKLNLHLNTNDFFRLFGITMTDTAGDSTTWLPSGAAAFLREMDLKELILSLPYPDMAIQSTFTGGAVNDTCHKVTVDFILESAWRWVKGLPVTVEGCVKNRQRDDFMKKCAEERKQYLDWCKDSLLEPEEKTLAWYYGDGGVRVDGEEPYIEGPEPVKQVPRRCKCTLSCSEKWTPED